MTISAIAVENLAKRYRLGARQRAGRTFRETLTEALGAPLRWFSRKGVGPTEPPDAQTLWALKDVSFDVQPGEVVGVIGRNGAGKSTLLKILSRITEPTEGEVEIRGRVGSLLEVGTGFHPELTGRENIFLNGAILGMSRSHIRRKFDDVVSFAEVERFIDTPVKHYSSGMYTRLAFAVAAHLEPDILIVDEVLAVGDGAFQQKCLGKMGEVAKHGRTILFVSHNMVAVRTLCQRAILLEAGRINKIGPAKQVTDEYLCEASAACGGLDRSWPDPGGAPGNDHVRLCQIRLQASSPMQNGFLGVDTELLLELTFWNLVRGARLIANLEVYTIDGVEVFETMSTEDLAWRGRHYPRGLFRCTCRVPANLLNAGSYRLRVAFLDHAAKVLFDYPQALFFTIHDVEDRDLPFFGKWQGVVRPKLQWRVDHLTRSLVDRPAADPEASLPDAPIQTYAESDSVA